MTFSIKRTQVLTRIIMVCAFCLCFKNLSAKSTGRDSTYIPSLTIAQLRSGAAGTSKVIFINQDLQSGTFKYDPGDTVSADDGAMTLVSGSNRYKRFTTYVTFEMFGAKGDYNYSTGTGTNDTQALQNAINWCSVSGTEIKLLAGKKYLTGTLYLYKDSVKNPGFKAKPGRIKITGQAGGIATGSLEPQGSALVHINGSASRLIECIGEFSIAHPGEMGGQIDFEEMNFIGGNQTTDVIYFEACQGQIYLKNYTVQIKNPAGNGISEVTTWETEHHNGLIRGQASGTGSWTGIGLNIKSNESTGQVNMKIYSNVNVYKCGYGIRIGRRAASSGTLGPLIFMGGQCSLSDQQNMWLDGGCYNLVSIGQQFEVARLNAILINSNGANDVERNIKFITPYFTGNGKIEDGSYNSYEVHIKDGVGVEFDGPLFNNLGNGIVFDRAASQGVIIRRPVVRTVRTYGTSSGTFIDAYGTFNANNQSFLEQPLFNQSPLNQVTDNAQTVFQTSAAGGRVSFSANATVVSASLGGGNLQAAKILNFNNSAATTISNITGGQLYRELQLTFSNAQTTIANNANIALSGAVNFAAGNKSSLRLMWMGTYWQEVARSQ